jgi:fimbrial isopeptide formation D2 family protein
VSVASIAATPSGTLGNAGIDARLTFQATSTATADNNAGNNGFVVRVRLIADNVSGNQAGTTLGAPAQLVYNDADGNGGGPATDRTVAATGGAPSVTVREPALTITKTANVDTTPVDADDAVDYTITIGNPSGGSNVNAYDLIFGDTFPSQLSSITLQSAEKGATGFTLGTGTNIATSFEVTGNTLQTIGGAAGDAGVNLDLAPGESIVLVVRGTVNAQAAAVSSFDSNSVVRWSSIDSTDNRAASQDANERTGADGVGGALNDYAVQDGAPVNVVPLAPSLSHVGGLADTAAPSPTTAAENVAIGEIVRYRGVVRIPEGSISDFNIQANLPSGLSYINDGTTRIGFVYDSAGGSLGSSVGAGLVASGTLQIPGNETAAEAGNLPSDLSNGPNAVLASGRIDTSSAQAPVFNFGTLTNNENDVGSEFVVIEFNARVDNLAATDTADSFNVSFTARSGNTVLGTSNTVVEHVVEPQITDLTKTVTSFDPDIGGGQGRATVTLGFTNSGDGAANDVRLADSVTGGSNYTITGVTIGSTTHTVATLPAGVTVSTTGGLTVDFSQLPVGTAVSVIYTVEVPANAAIAASDAVVTYSGLPESFTGFAGSTVGADATTSGERDGSGGATAPNDYQDTDGAGLGIITGTLWDDTNSANGTIDGGETRLSGQTVTLVWAGADGDLSTAGDNLTYTTTTDASGNYHFGALPTGNYRIVGPNSGGAASDGTLGSLNPRFDSDAGTLGRVDLTVSEGASATANIGYVQVNDAPVNVMPGMQNVVENHATPIRGISITDTDAGSGAMTVRLAVLEGTLNLTLSGGVTVSTGALGTDTFTLSGTRADLNASLVSLTYTPNDGYTSNDTLTMSTNDLGNTGDIDGDGTPGEAADALSDTDTVVIHVGSNSAPVATDDIFQVTTGSSVTIPIRGNDRDPEGDMLIVDRVNGQAIGVGGSMVVANGTVTLNADGTFTFTPHPGYVGPIEFIYRVSDGHGGFAEATVRGEVLDDAAVPDNLWQADRPMMPGVPYDRTRYEREADSRRELGRLHLLDPVGQLASLYSVSDVSEPGSLPVAREIARIGRLGFFGDDLNRPDDRAQAFVKPGARGHVTEEVNRIEHLRDASDRLGSVTEGSRSTWEVSGLRHSITFLPRESLGADYLTVHTTLSGSVLYIEVEHTRQSLERYDVASFGARQADGRPLPDWLTFDTKSGLLSGIPPVGEERLKLDIHAHLKDGRVLSGNVEIETDTGRLLSMKMKAPAGPGGGERFSTQVGRAANAFGNELARLRKALGG